ncbi:hypothetical protein GB927_016545 [Shinella sp. CPCC 100929]|uniref:Uncharacterized protein n=1 Tax=Shinella lacus TaxID=2654216 RepID=A0ABT1R908_9HYPH|nr:hypothetical protein [Shinella lacus]MCQ4631662.1 hypothetical protein [Shinella lacus]
MQNAKREISHLLLMAKLLAARQENALLCYFIDMAIVENRASTKPTEVPESKSDAA